MDTNQKLFNKVKLLVIDWFEQNQDNFKNGGLEVIILRNEDDGFVVSFENDIAMAELVVEEAGFAPYRFISFEVAAIAENQAQIVYSWYDSETTSENEIRRELNKGINYFINLTD